MSSAPGRGDRSHSEKLFQGPPLARSVSHRSTFSVAPESTFGARRPADRKYASLCTRAAARNHPVRIFYMKSFAPNVDSGATEKVLRWRRTWQAGGPWKSFRMRPIASPRAELIVRHRIEGGDFTPHDFTLTNDYPFLMDCKVQP